MGLSIIEIQSVPQYQLLDVEIGQAKHLVVSRFRDMLSYLSSSVNAEHLVIEIIFYKKSKQPRLFITIRNEEEQMGAEENLFVDTVCSYLYDLHFDTQKVSGKGFREITEALRSQLNSRIVALTKSEKIVASNVAYSGYYYYTDILDASGNGTADINNYNALMHQLLLCNTAMVAFQLLPTKLAQEEYMALSNLSVELAAMTNSSLAFQRQIPYEVSADAPKRTYTYYTEHISEPVFIGNIVVAAENGDVDGIVSALESCIRQSVDQSISLTKVELDRSLQLHYDFFHFPWNIYKQLLLNYRNLNIWNGTIYQPTNLMRLPFLYTISEALSFFKLPIDDGKIRGIHSNRSANDNEVLNDKLFDKDNIIFGKLINTERDMIGSAAAEFTRHALIVGVPGSGKTTFAINLLLQFYEKGIPFLAIEPTKTEYRALIDKVPDLQVFTPGNSSVIPFIINPFIPPKGIRLEQYIPSLMSAFRAAFSMESPLDVIFLRAIRQSYAEYGWKSSSTCDDRDVQYFGLYEFILVFKKIVSASAYRAETKANIETGGTFRLLNLLDQNKYIYDNINTIPIDLLLRKPTVIELNAIADDEQKALVMALLLIGICLYTKNKGSISNQINNVLMIDEAHVLLDAHTNLQPDFAKAQGTTVKSLQNMIAEIRSFGTGIIIADQVPSKVTHEIVADTDLKVSFRLVDQNERNIIANSTNMTEQQSQLLARLKRGEAIVYYSGLMSPKIIVTGDVRAEKEIRYQISDSEISEKVDFWKSRQHLLIPFWECTLCPQCAACKQCRRTIRERAEYYASHIISTIGSNIKDKETLVKYMYRLHELVIRYEAQTKKRESIKTVCNCTKIHFLREILLTGSFSLNRNMAINLLRKTLIRG